MDPTFDTLYDANGVAMWRTTERGCSWLTVMDDAPRYRVTLSRHDDVFHVGISAQQSDAKPGELANYTPCDEYSSNYVNADDISIGDAGLLSVMGKKRAATGVEIRVGFTVQLPVEFVTPVRQAIAMLIDANGDAP